MSADPAPQTQEACVNIDKNGVKPPGAFTIFMLMGNAVAFSLMAISFFIFFLLTSGIVGGQKNINAFNRVLGIGWNKDGSSGMIDAYHDAGGKEAKANSLFELRRAAEKEERKSTQSGVREITRGTTPAKTGESRPSGKAQPEAITSDPTDESWEEYLKKWNEKSERPKSPVTKTSKGGAKQSW